MSPRYVYLWSLPSPVILVPASTGVIYCNQVDGAASVQRALEGYLIPLPSCDAEIFSPSWWEKNLNRRHAGDDASWAAACRRIESALAGMLSGGEAPSDVRVVTHDDNSEAWIHVRFSFVDLGPSGDGQAVLRLDGVLTWQNCD